MTKINNSDIIKLVTYSDKKERGDNVKLYAEKLLKLRGEKTQDEVAKEIGIAKSTLSMYENGVRVPRDYIKIKLAEFYHVTVQEIFFT